MSTITLQSLEPLFFSPLLTFQLPLANVLNARLRSEIGAIRRQSPGVQRSNQNGWHSDDDFFDRKEPACRELIGHIVESVRQATGAISPQFDFAKTGGAQFEGWINLSGKGAYNTPHDHPGWAWSGSYYVHVPEGAPGRSGSIELLDTRTNTRVVSIEGAACYMGKYTTQPKSGQLLLFPSYLRHWVYPNELDEERISIAFNARFVPLKKG
jgi:uncharacterized protein (TIGR02466 family)